MGKTLAKRPSRERNNKAGTLGPTRQTQARQAAVGLEGLGSVMAASDVLVLQRQIGNRAVQREVLNFDSVGNVAVAQAGPDTSCVCKLEDWPQTHKLTAAHRDTNLATLCPQNAKGETKADAVLKEQSQAAYLPKHHLVLLSSLATQEALTHELGHARQRDEGLPPDWFLGEAQELIEYHNIVINENKGAPKEHLRIKYNPIQYYGDKNKLITPAKRTLINWQNETSNNNLEKYHSKIVSMIEQISTALQEEKYTAPLDGAVASAGDWLKANMSLIDFEKLSNKYPASMEWRIQRWWRLLRWPW